VLRVLGNLLNLSGFEYQSSEEVRDELRSLCEGLVPNNSVSTPASTSLPQQSETLLRIAEVPIYATDPVVRRAQSLQQTPDAVEAAVSINASLARRLGVLGQASVTVAQGKSSLTLPLVVDACVPDHCVLIPTGVKGSAGLGPAFGPIRIEGIAVAERQRVPVDVVGVVEPEGHPVDTGPQPAQPLGAPAPELLSTHEAVSEAPSVPAPMPEQALDQAPEPIEATKATGRRSSAKRVKARELGGEPGGEPAAQPTTAKGVRHPAKKPSR
jgi:hypothetical protein